MKKNDIEAKDLLSLNINDLVKDYKEKAENKSKEQVKKFLENVISFYVDNFATDENDEIIEEEPLLYLGVDHQNKPVSFNEKGHRLSKDSLSYAWIINVLDDFSKNEEKFDKLVSELSSKGIKLVSLTESKGFLMYPDKHGDDKVISDITKNMLEKYETTKAEEEKRKTFVKGNNATTTTDNEDSN